jgi:hypothetical protein
MLRARSTNRAQALVGPRYPSQNGVLISAASLDFHA